MAAVLKMNSNRYGLNRQITGEGAGVYGYAVYTGIGVLGQSSQGHGGVFQNVNGGKSALKLIPTNVLPSDKSAGSICYHSTHGFCVANGTNWYVPATWNIVT